MEKCLFCYNKLVLKLCTLHSFFSLTITNYIKNLLIWRTLQILTRKVKFSFTFTLQIVCKTYVYLNYAKTYPTCKSYCNLKWSSISPSIWQNYCATRECTAHQTECAFRLKKVSIFTPKNVVSVKIVQACKHWKWESACKSQLNLN